MTGMVAYTEHIDGQVSDPLQGPHLGLVAPVHRADQQRVLQLLQLLGREAGLGPTGLLREDGFRTSLPPFVEPHAHSFMTDIQRLSDLSQTLSLTKPNYRIFLHT